MISQIYPSTHWTRLVGWRAKVKG